MTSSLKLPIGLDSATVRPQHSSKRPSLSFQEEFHIISATAAASSSTRSSISTHRGSVSSSTSSLVASLNSPRSPVKDPNRCRKASTFDEGSIDEVGAMDEGTAILIDKKGTYFAHYLPRRKLRMESQRYRAKEGADTVGHWMSYSSGALNWDSLCIALEQIEAISNQKPLLPTSVPRRVLDLGCGIYANAILEMANRGGGWENTTFVGCDIAPVLLPIASFVDPSVAARCSFVQCDITKDKIPVSGTFDLIRISRLGLSIREDQWASLIEEATLLLSSDGSLHIIEGNFKVFHTSKSPLSFAANIEQAYETVLSNRFISPHSVLSIIPSTLAMYCREIGGSGRRSLIVPSHPFDFDASPASPPSSTSSTDSLSSAEQKESDSSRVLLHAYAERMAGSSQVVASEETSRQFDLLPEATASPDHPSFRSLHHRIEDELLEWTEQLKETGGISILLEKRFGWKCDMDLATEAMLESSPSSTPPATEGSSSPAEASSPFQEVRKRLHRGWSLADGHAHEKVARESLGKMEFASWSAKRL